MGIHGIRYSDLNPEIPLGDDSNCLEVYADCIGALQVHGSNFTITYCAFGRPVGSVIVHRIPVIKLVRPFTSLCDLKGMLTKTGRILAFPGGCGG